MTETFQYWNNLIMISGHLTLVWTAETIGGTKSETLQREKRDMEIAKQGRQYNNWQRRDFINK